MQVTSSPIATLSAKGIEFKLASGAVAEERFVALSNRGLGDLAITSVAATEVPWLAAELTAGLVKITADPADVVPGIHEASVTGETNAANSPHVVAVQLRAVPLTPPTASFRGVVNNATFAAGDAIPQGGIAAAFGEQLSSQPPASGSELPLVRELGGIRLLVNGIEAHLFFSSRRQINFQMPHEVSSGQAEVQIVRDGQVGNTVTAEVSATNPRILTFLGNYAIAQNTDETFAVPPTPGVPSRPAQPGDTLVMYAIGFGQTVPPVRTGEAAPMEPLSMVTPTPTIFLGSGFLPLRLTPVFAGLTPNFVGLFQINFTIPANAPRGDHVPLLIQGPGYTTNQVEIAIQ
ncbi:MAG: hypothetical protein GY953_22970 [bacterium]|nr:hypothetical protein [bacterium]